MKTICNKLVAFIIFYSRYIWVEGHSLFHASNQYASLMRPYKVETCHAAMVLSKGRFPLGVFLLADEKTKEKKLAERKKS